MMYMQEPSEESESLEIATGEALVLGICALAVFFFGIFPNGGFPFAELQLLDWARDSVVFLFGA